MQLEESFRATSVSTSFNVDTTERSLRIVCENPSTQSIKLYCITVRLPPGARPSSPQCDADPS